MSALAVLMRPTENGWGVYLSNGQELIRYRGLWSKQLALRYLARYTRSAAPRSPSMVSWWRRSADREL
jgi:hypothetical protein